MEPVRDVWLRDCCGRFPHTGEGRGEGVKILTVNARKCTCMHCVGLCIRFYRCGFLPVHAYFHVYFIAPGCARGRGIERKKNSKAFCE